MAKSALFAKLKGFGPLIVIGTAVAVTIKLLTTTTPTIQDELNVDAKEDISLTQYEDTIELPPPPPEPPAPPKEDEEEKEEEKEKGDEEEDAEDKETEEAGEETEEERQEAEEQAQEQQEQQNKPKPLKCKEGHPLTGLFSKLFKGDKKG